MNQTGAAPSVDTDRRISRPGSIALTITPVSESRHSKRVIPAHGRALDANVIRAVTFVAETQQPQPGRGPHSGPLHDVRRNITGSAMTDPIAL
jgi:hypothetical protein